MCPTHLGAVLKRDYDITLNRVPITDAADVVNMVLTEKEAGIVEGGAVDLIWINGENFRSMKAGRPCLLRLYQRLAE